MYLCHMDTPTNDKLVSKLYKKYFGHKMYEINSMGYESFKVMVKSVRVIKYAQGAIKRGDSVLSKSTSFEKVVLNLLVIGGETRNPLTNKVSSLRQTRYARTRYNREIRRHFSYSNPVNISNFSYSNPVKSYFDILYTGTHRSFEIDKITYLT